MKSSPDPPRLPVRLFAADDGVESVRVLRRGLHVSGGRSIPFDTLPGAWVQKVATGGCYVFQPERINHAPRKIGTTQDFADRPDDLLARFP